MDYKENIKGLFRYMGGILNKVRNSNEFSNLAKDDSKIYIEAYSKYHDGRNVNPETREFSEKRIIPVQQEFLGWMESEDIYSEPNEPSYKIDPEIKNFPNCVL